MPANFNVPSTIIVGGGARGELAAQLKRLGASHAFLVTDEGMVKLGVADEITAPLKAAGLRVTVFSDVQPDPTDRNVLDDAGGL